MNDGFSLNMDVFYPASLSIIWGPGNSFKTMCNSCMHISMNNFFIKFLKQRQREKKGASTSLPQSFPSFLSQSVPTCLPPSVTQYLLLKRTIKLHSFLPLPSSFLPFILSFFVSLFPFSYSLLHLPLPLQYSLICLFL